MKAIYDDFDALFVEIYNDNYNFLVKYLLMIVYDISIAEDLAHDIFLRIYKSKSISITGIQLTNYLKKAARNIAVDHLRRLAREERKQKKIIPELKDMNEAFYSSLENCVIEGEVISTVKDVLEEFSEKNRKIFISRILEHKTRRQVSQEEKISPYSVKRIESEILLVLRDKLKQYL